MESKTILVIEDDEVSQTLMEDILHSRGYNFLLAKNGVEGLKMAKEKKPDLILTDVNMPEMDGYTVQLKLQEDEATRDIPVVFITARNSLADTLQALAHGAVGFIEKPFNLNRLFRKVESLLEQKEKKKNAPIPK